MLYEFLTSDLINSKKKVGTDKGLARIGDNIVNLTYSMAKSIYLTKNNSKGTIYRTGLTVSKKVLANALRNADMKKDFARTRSDAHDLADTAEALIAYAWLTNKISINEIIAFLTENFSGDLAIRTREIENAISVFTDLLKHIKKFLPEK